MHRREREKQMHTDSFSVIPVLHGQRRERGKKEERRQVKQRKHRRQNREAENVLFLSLSSPFTPHECTHTRFVSSFLPLPPSLLPPSFLAIAADGRQVLLSCALPPLLQVLLVVLLGGGREGREGGKGGKLGLVDLLACHFLSFFSSLFLSQLFKRQSFRPSLPSLPPYLSLVKRSDRHDLCDDGREPAFLLLLDAGLGLLFLGGGMVEDPGGGREKDDQRIFSSLFRSQNFLPPPAFPPSLHPWVVIYLVPSHLPPLLPPSLPPFPPPPLTPIGTASPYHCPACLSASGRADPTAPSAAQRRSLKGREGGREGGV